MIRSGVFPRLLSALLLFATASSCNSEVDALGVRVSLQKKTLDNGLTVLLVEDHSVPVVSYQTWFRVGSIDEAPGHTGISHLFEHLMFKGTPRYGAKQFFQQLEAKGAEVNAFTTRDYTVYYENVVPPMLPKAIDMEADRMAHLQLDENVLNSERLVVLEERRMRTENSPEGRMQEALWALAYRAHSYQWPVIGYPQDLLQITTERLQDWFGRYYSPSNATLVVVGDFSPGPTFELIRQHYGSLETREAPKRAVSREPEQREERRLVLRDKVAGERFAQAYHVTSAQQDDSYALDVLANVLFEGTSSRAYRALVENEELMTGISGTAFTPSDPGLMIISGSMRNGIRAETAEKSLERVIREVQENGVTEEEIRIAVRQLTVQLVDSVRTPHGLGQFIGTVQMVFGDPWRFSKDLAKYLKVSSSDVKRVALKYLQPNNRSVVVMIPVPEQSATARVSGGKGKKKVGSGV